MMKLALFTAASVLLSASFATKYVGAQQDRVQGNDVAGGERAMAASIGRHLTEDKVVDGAPKFKHIRVPETELMLEPSSGSHGLHHSSRRKRSRNLEDIGHLNDSERNLHVLGRDDRIRFRSKRYPWSTVCRLFTGTGWGSGVLIGPRHVLTASHVINWRTGSVQVEVGRYGTKSFATTYAHKIFTYVKIDGTKLIPFSIQDDDYAVIVLRRRLGKRFGYMGSVTYRLRWDYKPFWSTFGYPRDIGKGVVSVRQRGKYLKHIRSSSHRQKAKDATRIMETNIDFIPGQSGSPVYAFFKKDPKVTCVMSTYSVSGRKWNKCSGGKRMVQLISWTRKNYP